MLLFRAPAGTVDRLQVLNCVAEGAPTLSDQRRSWLLAAYGCMGAMPEVPIVQSAEPFRALDLTTEVGGPSPTIPHAFATFTRLWAGDAPAGQELLTLP